MALGVEHEWAKQFERVYNQVPNWYSDPRGTSINSFSSSFNSFLLISALSGFNNSLNETFTLADSAPGGHSGFGGGGFSGGGFGGGGGGSW